MYRRIGLLLLAALPLAAFGVGGGSHLHEVDIDLTNQASLQRGVKYFVNYCSGCHSARYLRYNRVVQDLGLSVEQAEKNLIFTDQKVGDTMTNAMASEDGAKWFGKAPPDLSLIARTQGSDWLYSYLKGFYLDPSRPLGVNNLAYPNVSMPHVLWELQGWREPVYKKGAHGAGKAIDHLELVEPGLLSPQEYDVAVRDLVAFLTYMGEPAQLARLRVGTWVMLFLAVMLVLSYLLYKEYWKDVH
jgi:ubiquinol-cytochrome c reductase cytochrome c1 subunit